MLAHIQSHVPLAVLIPRFRGSEACPAKRAQVWLGQRTRRLRNYEAVFRKYSLPLDVPRDQRWLGESRCPGLPDFREMVREARCCTDVRTGRGTKHG